MVASRSRASIARCKAATRCQEEKKKLEKKKKDEYDKTEKKGKIQMNKKRLGACWSEVLLTFFFYDPFFGHKLNKPLTRKVGGRWRTGRTSRDGHAAEIQSSPTTPNIGVVEGEVGVTSLRFWGGDWLTFYQYVAQRNNAITNNGVVDWPWMGRWSWVWISRQPWRKRLLKKTNFLISCQESEKYFWIPINWNHTCWWHVDPYIRSAPGVRVF